MKRLVLLFILTVVLVLSSTGAGYRQGSVAKANMTCDPQERDDCRNDGNTYNTICCTCSIQADVDECRAMPNHYWNFCAASCDIIAP